MSVSVTFVGSVVSFGSGGQANTCFLVDAPRFPISRAVLGYKVVTE
jgi:hypothetical protein